MSVTLVPCDSIVGLPPLPEPGKWRGLPLFAGSADCFVYASTVPATYMVQVEIERGPTGNGPAEDDLQVNTHHWRWDGAADPGDTDFAIVEARLTGFYTAIQQWVRAGARVKRYRWYVEPRPAGSQNQALRTTEVDVNGSSLAKILPPQCAVAVTERTDIRRRWGRFYLGSLTVAAISDAGRTAPDFMTAIANAADIAFNQNAANWKSVVFSRSLSPASLEVRFISVDDVMDVIRRRRHGVTLLRETRDVRTT